MKVHIGSIEVAYEQKGRGEPILLVHGWGGTHNSLTRIAEYLSSDFTVMWLDLPGFGQSANPPATWGVGEYAQFLREFVQETGQRSTHYFGHSFGGSLGIYLAAHHPEVIKKLVLCDSSYKRTAKAKTEAQTQTLAHRIKHHPLLRPAKRLMYRVLYPNSDALRHPQLESNFRKIITHDLSGELDAITQETLILWGELDRDTPITLAHGLKQGIKRSTLVTFPDIGHGLPLTHPEVVAKEVKKFLKGPEHSEIV